MTSFIDRSISSIVVVTIALLAGYAVFPAWFSLMIVAVAAKALVVLGVVILMRGGSVSFGQGLYYCIGGYTVGLATQLLGVTDIFALLGLVMLVGAITGGIFGTFMSRYREIFFAMFSLALSMILYGVLSRSQALGSTDGINVLSPTVFGMVLSGSQATLLIYCLTCIAGGVFAILAHCYFRSPLGYASLAVESNEVRVEYLGLAPQTVLYSNYLVASVLSAFGGGIAALNYGHVGPSMAYWVQSGEFIFIALMGGAEHIAGAFIGSLVFEVVRTYALQMAPSMWRIILGSVLIIIILFLPRGLWSMRELGRRGVRKT